VKIICIGRNYVAHAAEMKSEVPSEPVFFMKPETAIHKDEKWYYPDFSKEIHHEVEIIVKISKTGKHIAPEFAGKYYNEIGLGIDFTARDLQHLCKSKGLPWEIAKAFDCSAVVSNKFIPKSDLDLTNVDFRLNINRNTTQVGNTRNMLFSIDELIAYLSKFITLKTGDLIFTGTPEGVGPVTQGDLLTGNIGNVEMFSIEIC